MAEYEGGIGGKFSKRPFRRAPATPYDRPPAALRGSMAVHVSESTAMGGGGWMSKLVDPASKMIATGASRIFSSVFRKRLPALPPPPSIPEGNHQSRHVPELARTVPSSELQKEERERDSHRSKFDNDGIAELEQRLKQKTFTRVEFDHLIELLHSRTVEPYKGETENSQKQLQQPRQCFSNEKKESTNVSAQADGIESLKVHGSLVFPSDSLTILQDQAASPAELAKAYMGTRPSKASSSAAGLRNQFFREEKSFSSIPFASKPLDLSVTPRSAIRFSGIPEHPENCYRTPRPPGRSAIYRMSRSPYFKINPTPNVKGGDGYTYTSSSQWTPRSAMQSGGKQVLKRGSSVLDGDFGSIGPIRRIRQKYSLSSSKDTRSSLSGSPRSSPLALPFKEFPEGSSVQKPLLSGKPKHGSTGSQTAASGISNASFATVPTQSSETAHRLFQQLDRLLPSQVERSSEMKTINREESSSELTLDMLHGRALKSMAEIGSSKFSSRQGTTSHSHFPTSGSLFSGKMDVLEENGHPKSDIVGVKLTSETNEVKTASIPSTSGPSRIFANSAVPPQSKKPSFQMSAPEDSLELVDDEYPKGLASPLITGRNGTESRISEPQSANPETAISEPELKMLKKDTTVSKIASPEAESKLTNCKEVTFGTSTSEKSLMTSSESIAVSSSISFLEADKKASPQPVISGEGIGLPRSSNPSSHSQQHLTSTMSTPSLNQPTLQKEQTTSPVFNFGSKAAGTLSCSSTTLGVNDTAGVKLDAGLVSDLKSSNSHAEGSNLIKGGETQKSGALFKSFGSTVSSGLSTSVTPAIFSFGASTSPSLSNGTSGLCSPAFPVSATPAIKFSETPTGSIFPSSTATTSNSIPSISSASSIPSFHFGSGTSSTTAVPTSLDKPKSPVVVTEPTNASSFNISNSTTLGESMFGNTGSGSSSMTTFAFSGSGSRPSALTSGISTDKNNSSSTPASSSLFSSMGVSSSSLAPSSLFPSTGSGVFGFTGSSQSSSSSISFANSNSQNSTTAFGGTGGSIFGTQSNLPGDGTSLISESSTSNVPSFSPSPAFGLSNSSSSTLGVTPLGSTTPGANPFTLSSGFSISTGSGPSSASTSSSFMPAFSSSGMFSSTSQASTSSIFGSASTSSTSPATGFSFGFSAPGSASSASLYGTSSSTAFSFGSTAPGSGSSPFTFGSSSGSAPTTSSTHSSAQPAFGLPNPASGFNFASPGLAGNDQMNVEDSMTDDTNQASSFPTNHQSATPGFVFGSSGVQPGAPFQFGSNPSGPQNPSPFQATGALEVPQGGSFSLGSGGGDKSGRRTVKPRVRQQRKK